MNTRRLAAAAATCGVLAGALGIALAVVLFSTSGEPDGLTVILMAGAMAVAWLAAMAFVAIYVYYDAESRGMKGALWALLIFLFAHLPGFIVYLLMRTPRLRNCPVCSNVIRDEYVVCPTCQTQVGLGCPRCHRRVESDWAACPYCQNNLAPAPAYRSP